MNILSLIDAVLREHGLDELPGTIELRRHETAPTDIRVFLPNAAPPQRRSVASMLERLPEVEHAEARKATVAIRLTDACIDSAGRALEEGSLPLPEPLAARDPRRFLIGFLGPNTSKALHLGHLRNVITGNALASAFARAGARSHSYSLVGDIGRNVCEAMAGFELLHRDESPRTLGIKPDQFVGLCYYDYLKVTQDQSTPATAGQDDPCIRERVPSADRADAILGAWCAGDPATRRLWREFRDMVLNGHDETLHRLGVTVDGSYYESEHVDHARELIARGVRAGILRQLEDGMVVYETGRDEFAHFVLQRSDGFPTEHGRVLAVFHQIFLDHPDGCVHIDWNGTEWQPAQAVLHDLMRALDLIGPRCEHHPTFHGMVLLDGDKMSSSSTKPVLIDELLDAVITSPSVTAMAGADREAVADFVIKGFFLSEPVSTPIAYSWARLMDPAANRGWQLARAWTRAHASAAGTFEPGAYRLAVLQAHAFPRVLRAATENLQLSTLTRYLLNLCERYLAAGANARLDAVARTTLGAVSGSLGFLAGTEPHRPLREDNVYAAQVP